MKDAYSNFTGDFFKAHEITHGDEVADFQMVCPCCRESVFHVERSSAEDKTVSYFSHYKASSAFTEAECERRVAWMSEAEKAQETMAARNQTLAMFRSVMREALHVMPIAGEIFDQSKLKGLERALYYELTVSLKRMVSDWGPKGLLINVVQKNDRAIAQAGHENLTPLGLSYRNRIAADIVRTLFASGSDKTVLYTVSRAHNAAFRLKGQSWNGMVNFDLRSRSLKLSTCEAIKKEIDRLNDPWGMTAYATLDAMLRELHRVPYLKMIANAKAKKRPLDGITLADYLPDLEDAQPNVNYVPPQGVEAFSRPISDEAHNMMRR